MRLSGDRALFAREDYVEEAWRIVDPILKEGVLPRPGVYDAGMWGCGGGGGYAPRQRLAKSRSFLREKTMYDMVNMKKLPVLGGKAPKAFEAFVAFDKAALADGVIPKKYKEMIAVAVALTTQCPYCIAIHKDAAIKAGVTEEEFAELTFVAAALRAGGAVTHGTHLIQGQT